MPTIPTRANIAIIGIVAVHRFCARASFGAYGRTVATQGFSQCVAASSMSQSSVLVVISSLKGFAGLARATARATRAVQRSWTVEAWSGGW